MSGAAVRGLFAEKIVISTALDPYMSLRALAAYSSLSARTLRGLIDRPPATAIPCYRIAGGKILVRRSEFDTWIARHRAVGRPSLALALKEIGLSP